MFLLLHTRRTLVTFTANSSLLHRSSLYLSPLHYFSTSKLKHESAHSSLVSDFLIKNHQISPQVALRVASALTHLKSTANPDSVISFLKDYGFSQTQLEKLIQKRPKLLSASLDQTIRPKLMFFQDFGFSVSEIAAILSKNPWILNNSLSNTLAPSLPVLKGLLGSNAQVAKLLMISGSFSDLEKTLVPNIDYLTSCGVEMDQIRRFLCCYWRFLLKPDVMNQSVDRADRLGADRTSGLFLRAFKVVTSMSEEA